MFRTSSEAGFDEGRNVTNRLPFCRKRRQLIASACRPTRRAQSHIVYTARTVSALAMKAATSMIPVGSRPARIRSNRVWWPASTAQQSHRRELLYQPDESKSREKRGRPAGGIDE